MELTPEQRKKVDWVIMCMDRIGMPMTEKDVRTLEKVASGEMSFEDALAEGITEDPGGA